MNDKKKVGIITHDDFTKMHNPPFPKPSFIAFENPNRISMIIKKLDKKRIFENSEIVKLDPLDLNDSDLLMAHTAYHIESIKRISEIGGGIIAEEVFITNDTFDLAKKAVGGSIQAIKAILEGRVNQSFAIIRPPGHHAMRESASGLCIFNNIALTIFYIREKFSFNGKIAIIDIDDHYGDGLARYFYEDQSVLYFSIHEFDYENGDLGLLNELGGNEAKGTNINFAIPPGITDPEFMLIFDVLEPILREFEPELIIVASGFDMYFADPIGNCQLTSETYHKFAKKLNTLSKDLCDEKIAFILEGGYSLIGLPYCTLAIVSALLEIEYEAQEFENYADTQKIRDEVKKIKKALINSLSVYWEGLNRLR